MGNVSDAHSECSTFSMVSSLIIFSKGPSYLDLIANGTTRALMNTGLSSITRDDTWIYLRFAFELVSNKLGYC